jgi:hypothetical protein
MNGGENEQIPYTAEVLETGVVPKPRKNATKKNGKVGLLGAMGLEFSQNSLWMSFWRFGDLMDSWKIWNRAPAGWSAADNISGIFEDYRDYLEKSKNPKELLLRKKYVIQRINYERKMAQASRGAKIGGAILSPFLDPFTYLFGAGIGGATKGIGVKMAQAGAGRISSSIVHGAAMGALFDVAHTTTKKALAADVHNPEYHIIGSALWGGALGGVGGMLSESAGLARFKIQHGDHGVSDYNIFRSYDSAKRKLWSGGYGGLDAKEQLILSAALEDQVDAYLSGDLAASKYRGFDIDLGNVSQDGKVSTVGKFLGAPINLGAKALNWMKGKFSNQLALLTSKLDALRVAGMKIFPTSTYEGRLAAAVGNEEPLVTTVARQNAQAERTIFMAFKEGWQAAKKDGISKDVYNDRLFNALSSKTAYGEETNPAIRKSADSIRSALDEAAKELHAVGGFQWQKDAREAYHATVNHMAAMVKKLRPEDTESAKSLQRSLAVASENYRYSLSPASLQDAVERMGGSYFPRHVDGGKVQSDRAGAVRALADSHVKSKGEWVRSQLAEKHGELLKNVTAEDPTDAWNQYQSQLKDRGWDIFSEPQDGMPPDPTTLHYSEKFLNDAVALAENRASDAVESSLATARGYSPRRVKMRNALERSREDPETHPRGSAKARSYHDDFDTIRKYLDNDVLSLAKKYVNQMFSDAAMIRIFGDEHAITFTSKIIAEYDGAVKRIAASGKDGSEILKATTALRKDVETGLRAMETAINHVKGFVGVDWSSVGEGSVGQRTIGIMSNWNVVRYLSDSIFSQFQDQANVALRLDGWKTFGQSLTNLARVMTQPRLRQEFVTHIRDFGIGAGLYMDGQRAQTLITTAEKSGLLGSIETATETLARGAMHISGTHYLDAFTQCNTSYLTGCELKRMAQALKSGKKFSDFQMRFSEEYRLTPDDFIAMADQFEKFSEVRDGVTSINVSQWDNPTIKKKVIHILHDNAVKATMIPGAELPQIFKSPLGKMLLQFKSFTTTTFNRMFIPSIESGNVAMANAMAQCLILDTLGRWFKGYGKVAPADKKDPVTGKKRQLNIPETMYLSFQDSITSMDWAAWAFDPTGITGSILHPEEASSQFGGTMNSMIRDFGYTTKYVRKIWDGGEPTNMEKRAAWRMLPFQNWWGTRSAIALWRTIFPQQPPQKSEKGKHD